LLNTGENVGSNVTIVLTSCDRHDLLHDTLSSFVRVRCGGIRPDGCIIIEDSTAAMPSWLKGSLGFYSACLGRVTWLNNRPRRGQVASIDCAYSRVTTDYIFHLEDDWHFNECDFIQESLQILQHFPEVIQVSLRGNTGWHRLIDLPRYPFKIAMPYWDGDWGGLSWNPGLRRLCDYARIGSYGACAPYGVHPLTQEAAISRRYLDMGYRIADLGRPIVTHTGEGRTRTTRRVMD
jgi:hypothetical protein